MDLKKVKIEIVSYIQELETKAKGEYQKLLEEEKEIREKAAEKEMTETEALNSYYQQGCEYGG